MPGRNLRQEYPLIEKALKKLESLHYLSKGRRLLYNLQDARASYDPLRAREAIEEIARRRIEIFGKHISDAAIGMYLLEKFYRPAMKAKNPTGKLLLKRDEEGIKGAAWGAYVLGSPTAKPKKCVFSRSKRRPSPTI